MKPLGELLSAWSRHAANPLGDIVSHWESDRDVTPESMAAVGWLRSLMAGESPPSTDRIHPDVAAHIAAAATAIDDECARPENQAALQAAALAVSSAANAGEVAEAMWSAFCPSAVGLTADWDGQVAALRGRRALRAVIPATEPIRPEEILLSANVMLTRPLRAGRLPDFEAAAAARAADEPPVGFFDHPIPIDSPPHNHELTYGLAAMNTAMEVEAARGVIGRRVPVVLSVSTTHSALDAIAWSHVADRLRDAPFTMLDVYAFTEDRVEQLLAGSVAPAVDAGSMDDLRRVFGVAGAYGRHYSFLKAVAPLWSVLIDGRIRATFKFDLDQVFPQDNLIAATGRTALQSLCSPLWGGSAADADGRAVALDLVAGSLVNDTDIGRGLHVPDVVNPGPPQQPQDFIFYPALPQALSTEAEMMPDPEGRPRQRVHITGGTTGATVDGLRRFRPFSPSFWGRAEDQAFALSMEPDSPLATLHLPETVMRHDKHSFASEAIAAAAVDKLIGDLERTFMFSAYVRMVDPQLDEVPAKLAPFTGAFVSRMPATVAYLRLILTSLSWAAAGNPDGARLFTTGLRRLESARQFTSTGGRFAAEIAAERRGWAAYYDALDRLESGLADGEEWAIEARRAARQVVSEAAVSTA